jgi:hypothetical protein
VRQEAKDQASLLVVGVALPLLLFAVLHGFVVIRESGPIVHLSLFARRVRATGFVNQLRGKTSVVNLPSPKAHHRFVRSDRKHGLNDVNDAKLA